MPLPAGYDVSGFVAVACLACGGRCTARYKGLAYHLTCIPVETAAPVLRFLERLHDDFPPRRTVMGRLRRPLWQPPLPEITDRVRVSSWSWKRPHDGPLAVLDATAAYMTGASSVEVAHGALVHTPDAARYDYLPGFYKLVVHPWTEPGLPHPLGNVEVGDEIWFAHPRVQLVQRLADAGRYPDGTIVDAWTCGRDQAGKPNAVRLNKWTDYMKGVRADVIARYGYKTVDGTDVPQYKRVKDNFSQARALMTGRKTLGQGRSFDPTSRIHRPDWGFSIAEQSAANLWRAADDVLEVLARLGYPYLGPVSLRNVDELVVPQEAVPLIRKTPRSRGRGPLPIDQAGLALGTFKVKAIEQ